MKYYYLQLSSIQNVFSKVDSGTNVNFQIETTNKLIDSVDIESDDTLIISLSDRIYYGLKVINKNEISITIRKLFEIEKSIGYNNNKEGLIKEITEEEYNSICSKLFSSYRMEVSQPPKRVDLGNLKERFTDWFIKFDGTKHNYFSDSFSSNRDKLLEQLTKYENLYKAQFGKFIFNIPVEDTIEFINELEKNLYLETGDFFQFSLKTSTHMPRAILGKSNYLKFLKELLGKTSINQIEFKIESFHKATKEAGLIFSPQLIQRFIASLCTKPFVICSGLSGSGKTKLAQAFAQWICYKEEDGEKNEQYCIVPVGADWTNREPLLGYPNALNKEEYVSPENGVLDLMIRAKNDFDIYLADKTKVPKPYFLILDEMNLSHVERYFADFLSTMESGDPIPLHKIVSVIGEEKIDIPQSLKLPKNLFIIGTVNIDETTYMFSPKVLDRANTIEFRLTEKDLVDFIASDKKLNMNLLKAQGANMSDGFMAMALKETNKNLKPSETDLKQFFSELKKSGAEFGYRTASEIGRLMYILKELGESGDNLLDIAIMQKLLPKLHGSRSKLNTALTTLAKFCIKDAVNDFDGKDEDFRKIYFIPFDKLPTDVLDKIKYKISFEKISRMHKNAMENGFTSYAEA